MTDLSDSTREDGDSMMIDEYSTGESFLKVDEPMNPGSIAASSRVEYLAELLSDLIVENVCAGRHISGTDIYRLIEAVYEGEQLQPAQFKALLQDATRNGSKIKDLQAKNAVLLRKLMDLQAQTDDILAAVESDIDRRVGRRCAKKVADGPHYEEMSRTLDVQVQGLTRRVDELEVENSRLTSSEETWKQKFYQLLGNFNALCR